MYRQAPQRYEECRTLHPDGASASILEHAIVQLEARMPDMTPSIEWRRSTFRVFYTTPLL